MNQGKVAGAAVPVIVLILAVPTVVLSSYRLGLLALVATYSIASLAQNLLAGYADVPFLGNVTFFATSAYTTGSLIELAHVPVTLALVLGIIASGILGIIVGLPALRISGMHLAIVSVALIFVAQEIMGQWDQAHTQFAGGVSVTQPQWMLEDRGLYVAAVIAAGLSYLLIRNILQSRSGRAILAVSENPYAAIASGVNIVRYRLMIVTISGMMTGLAGGLYLYYEHTVTPSIFSLDLSLSFLTMMILGGSRSLGGSLLGALSIGLLPEVLSVIPTTVGPINVQQSMSALYAILLLVTLRLFPEGIWKMASSGLHFPRGRPPTKEPFVGDALGGQVMPENRSPGQKG